MNRIVVITFYYVPSIHCLFSIYEISSVTKIWGMQPLLPPGFYRLEPVDVR